MRFAPLLVFVALPLSTAAQEVAMGLCLVLALLGRWRHSLASTPLLGEAALLALVWTLSSLASGNLHEGLGHAWLLAPFVALALFPRDPRVTEAALFAAGVAALWGIGQRVTGGVAHGGFSHHLSFAYALLPPLAWAVHQRRWGFVGLLATGMLATGSEAIPVAMLATAAAAWWGRPALALLAGVALTVLGVVLAGDYAGTELQERAVIWTGALSLVPEGGVGAGAYRAASALAYDGIQPGFWFPNHAHDAQLQALAVLGPAGLVAQLALIVAAFRSGHRAAAAGLVGILVGGLTQETLGDLEVARAAWVWLAWLGSEGDRRGGNFTPFQGASRHR